MEDKIYSRPRIKIQSWKNRNRRQKIKYFFNSILLFLLVCIVLILKAAYPVFVACCENAAISSATNILNKEVNEVMLVYNYNDLVSLGKDDQR